MAGYKTPPGTIVNTIKSLLKERYKQGFPIIKEIIQNANDGGATTLDFGVIKGLREKINHPLLKIPALFFLNDGTFNESDREAILSFGVDANAGDKSKIGKFGLGQKSIFHFCDAFFYIARSKSIPDGCGEFINPWADTNGKDSKRPDWIEISEDDRKNLEKYLTQRKLVNSEKSDYFLLWVPLRQKTADGRSILAKYYDEKFIQAYLPEDMEARIGQLLPLLRHLKSVRYWLEDKNNQLQQQFSVSLDSQSALKRCIHPNKDSEKQEGDEQELQGKVILSSDTTETGIAFAGKEKILSANNFASLLGQTPENVSSNFWFDLKQSEYWSKRISIDENGESENIPDKSIPHSAVVFTSQPKKNHKASLVLQWSVFLPLASDDNGSNPEAVDKGVYEIVKNCEGDKDYNIFLHGYFFLDSGRKYIEGLSNLRNGELTLEVPKNEDEMIAQWNYLLATKGTLELFLSSLRHFAKTHGLSSQDISCLCEAVLKSRLFQNPVYRKSICGHNQCVYRIKPNNSTWTLIPVNASAKLLPGVPPNWEVFPELSNLAERHCLIDDRKPNLLLTSNSNNWQEEEVVNILESLDIRLLFSHSDNIKFLLYLLGDNKRAIGKPEIQASLITVLRESFKQVSIKELQEKNLIQLTKKLIKLIHPERRFKIKQIRSNEEPIQKVLNQLYQLNIGQSLLVYELFEPNDYASKADLSDEQVKSILNCLSKLLNVSDTKAVAKAIIEQILNQSKSLESDLSLVPNIPLFCSYNYRQNIKRVYSFNDLKELKERSLLFKGNHQTQIAQAVKSALPECELIFIEAQISKILERTNAFKNIPHLNANSCLQLLANKPNLADSEKRENLLKELINHV
ncbi:hypothetical protein NIES267_42140 [Calothrix parasitica NIES-267]|uniref:Sacsin/Nov domain-containing protein n=1 Tax=Calothrix parasitica NIES-267 TaxID=1973488 RepID=A0A1Z4LUH0_9CYAN|nr:hypothetical protein NIES267_42140 [Calothrix parasitica NIES-267]